MQTRFDRQRAPKQCVATAIFLALLLAPGAAVSQYNEVDRVKTFGIIDISGRFEAGYFFDDRKQGERDEVNVERRSTWQEEFFLLSKSFIYHPGFLNIELGGGPIFIQQQFDDSLGNYSQKDTLFNFVSRLNFLELKNYPFSVYFERSHPSVTTGQAGRFHTQNERYGLNSRIFRLFGGSTVAGMSMSHQDVQGSGFGSVVDDSIDKALFSLSTNYRVSDSLAFKFDKLEQTSASGSSGLPIVESTTVQEISEIRSENSFGVDKPVFVSQTLQRLQQTFVTTGTTSQINDQYLANLRWNPSSKTRSFFRYRRLDTKRTDSIVLDSGSEDVELGFTREANKNFSYEAAFERNSEEQTGFNRDQSALRSTVRVTGELGAAKLGLSASLRAARADQESGAADIAVFDELHVLQGTARSNLVNEFVVPGSVVVSNEVRTQVFVEGLDYRLLTTGSITSVQRLINGSIADGESVLVDYRYESSGTAKFDTRYSGVSVTAGLWDFMDLHIRYDTQDLDVVEGELTNVVNNRDGLEYGIGISHPIFARSSISGRYRHREWDEDISSFVSDSLTISLNTTLRGTWNLTMSGGLDSVDFADSAEDTEQTTLSVGLSGRLFGSGLSYDATHIRDDGGSLPREQLLQRLSFQWTYRQVRVDIRAYHTEESLGSTDRSDTSVSARLTRLF